MADRYDRRDSMGDDDAPHSRLFIVGSKLLTEDEVRDAFKEFGYIKKVKAVRDRNTGENKGIFYVKYGKTSDAARALEGMKGKVLGNRPLKVMIASNREQGSVRDENEEDNVKRLFVVVSKTASDNEVYDYFKQFGEIEYASILKHRETRESKGFAYIKFIKFSDAANAYENCEKSYKAKFAEPRKPREDLNRNSYNNMAESSMPSYRMPAVDNGGRLSLNYQDDGLYKLSVIASTTVNQDQMWKLFDIVPSLDYCQIGYDQGSRDRVPSAAFEVVYRNSEWASYAVEKFHGFEYPPGHRLIVKVDNQRRPGGGGSLLPAKRPAATLAEPSVGGPSTQPDLLQLAETIAQASSLLKAAGLSPDLLQSKLGSPSSRDSRDFCSVELPQPRPMLHIDTKCEARCFFVCFPKTLPQKVLKDVFCRFGDLIDAFLLHNKSYGYAKYASKEAADAAIKTLHGAEVLGSRLKVFEAEERPDKRQKMEIDNTGL